MGRSHRRAAAQRLAQLRPKSVDEDYYYSKPGPGDRIEQRFKVGDRAILLREGPNYGKSYTVKEVYSPQRKDGDRGNGPGKRTFVVRYSLHGLNHGVTDAELAPAGSLLSRLKKWYKGRGVRRSHVWVQGKGYINKK